MKRSGAVYSNHSALTVQEAAKWIAGHSSPRTWQRYEGGTRNMPDSIEIELYALSQQCEIIFDEIYEKALSALDNNKILTLKFYQKLDEYLDDHPKNKPITWRIYQSAASRIFREFGSRVELV